MTIKKIIGWIVILGVIITLLTLLTIEYGLIGPIAFLGTILGGIIIGIAIKWISE